MNTKNTGFTTSKEEETNSQSCQHDGETVNNPSVHFISTTSPLHHPNRRSSSPADAAVAVTVAAKRGVEGPSRFLDGLTALQSR